MKGKSSLLFVLCALLVSAVLLPEAAAAAPSTKTAAARPLGTTAWRHLAARARSAGTIRLLVGLDLATRPEGELSRAEVKAQRVAIARARASLLASLRGKGVRHVTPFAEIPFVGLELSAHGIASLQHAPHVLTASESRERTLADAPPDATSSNDWYGLDPWWHFYRMNVDDSTRNGYTGNGQTVAIIDTGVDTRHPYVAGRVVSEACFASAAENSAAGYCPNGSAVQAGAGTGTPCTFSDECAHGTHVAGIAAGRYGVAPAAKIIAIKVFHPTYDCEWYETVPCARADDWDILTALRHVYALRTSYRIASVNLSLGGDSFYGFCDSRDSYSKSVAAVVANLRSYGTATVVATGNAGDANGIGFPACVSNTVPVGNTTVDYDGSDAVSDSSNSSPYVWLLAPGTSICSSYPSLFPAQTNGCDGSTTAGTMSGTSMAAPQVAGAFAALKQLRPTATVTAALNALYYSGRFVLDDRNNVSRPRIDVWAALTYLYNH